MNYHRIFYDNMLNGDGLRAVLFVSGCAHHCKNCQNPQTWDKKSGKEFTKSVKQELLNYLKNDYVSGITLSGGDPLYNHNVRVISNLCEEIKSLYADKTIWMYTGYTIEEILADKILKNAIKYVDVLIDGRYDENLADKNYKWAGSTNQRIIDVQKTLDSGEIILYKV